jgi:hypothetical protein
MSPFRGPVSSQPLVPGCSARRLFSRTYYLRPISENSAKRVPLCAPQTVFISEGGNTCGTDRSPPVGTPRSSLHRPGPGAQGGRRPSMGRRRTTPPPPESSTPALRRPVRGPVPEIRVFRRVQFRTSVRRFHPARFPSPRPGRATAEAGARAPDGAAGTPDVPSERGRSAPVAAFPPHPRAANCPRPVADEEHRRQI